MWWRAAMRWPDSRCELVNWWIGEWVNLCALSQDEVVARRHERVAPGIAVEAAPRAAAADFPSGRIVAARRAAHHHPVALVVHDRIVSAHSTQQLSEPPHRARDHVAF